MQKKQNNPTKKDLKKIYGKNYRKFLNRMKMRNQPKAIEVIFVILD